MKDGFYPKQIDKDLCILFCTAPHNDQNRDRKPRKVHQNKQIIIGIASNINWHELLKICHQQIKIVTNKLKLSPTNQNCHQQIKIVTNKSKLLSHQT